MRLGHVIACVCLGLVLGCGGPARTTGFDAKGTAVLDGTPLEMGLVVLEPEAGGAAKSGQISKDGSFTLYGIEAGRYKAAVQTSMFAGMQKAGEAAAAQAGEGRPVAVRGLDGTFRAVPAAFEKPATSGLVVEVRQGEPLRIEINGK